MFKCDKAILYQQKRCQWLILIFFLCFFSKAYVQSSYENNGYTIKTVVIDPGHGGKDPGAVGKNSKEKDIVLGIGLKLGEYFSTYMPDVKVVFTRDSDVFIPLHQRAEIANQCKADLFISIHTNSWTNPNSNGTETLVLGLHRADENFEVAKRENSVILLEEDYNTTYEGFDPNSPESYIIFSLMQNVYFEQSIIFGSYVQENLKEKTERKDRGVKQQGLLVLARSSMPGVLIETGFISNQEEEKYLLSAEGQNKIARSIFEAFKEYKKSIESKSAFTVEENTDQNQTLKNTANLINSNTTPDNNGIRFKVQINASKTIIPIDSDYFKGFSNVEVFHVNDMYKYAVGLAYTYADILKYSKRIKTHFPDAFIIALKDNEIIPIHKALKELQN